MVNTPDRDTLIDFARTATPPVVSMYLPVLPPVSGHGQEPAVLRKLVADARRRLDAEQIDDTARDALLAPASSLAESTTRSYKHAHGLALLLSADIQHVWQLPLAVPEHLSVGPRPYIVPMTPVLSADDRLLLLALSQQRARLFDFDRWTLTERAVEGLDEDSFAHLLPNDRERSLQLRQASAGASDAAFFHGHGGAKDLSDARRQAYLREVDRALHPVLAGRDVPMIVAGVRSLVDEFRALTSHSDPVGTVAGNPDTLTDHALLDAAWHAADRAGATSGHRAISRLDQAVEANRVTSQLTEITTAAREGRMDLLVVAEEGGVVANGTDPDADINGGASELEATQSNRLNDAVIETLLHGGDVIAVDVENLGDRPSPAGVLRY